MAATAAAAKPTTISIVRGHWLSLSLPPPSSSIAKNHRRRRGRSRGAARTFSIVVDRPPEIGLMQRRASVERGKQGMILTIVLELSSSVEIPPLVKLNSKINLHFISLILTISQRAVFSVAERPQ